MTIFKHFCAATVLILALGGNAQADNNFGVGLKVGTLGLGLEGRWAPLPFMDVRVGANAYDFSNDGRQAGVEYDATLDLETFYASANFHFPLSPFRVTAGVYSNGNELQMVSAEPGDFTIGGSFYTAAEVGTLTSVTSFGSTAPYLGVGFDFEIFGKAGLNLDFGVLWQGDPDVTLEADGLLAQDANFLAALDAEREELSDEMNDFKAYPVISLSVVYNF